jgi:paraquat-inducible protein A
MLFACPECDRLHRWPSHSQRPAAETFYCVRCGSVLRRSGRPGAQETSLALTLAALLLFGLANAFPLVSLDLHGTVQTATLPGCVEILAAVGWPGLAAILLTTVLLVPLLWLLGLISVLLRVSRGQPGPGTGRLLRYSLALREWGMAEVFLLGILISYVKLSSMAVVLPGPSLFALVAFVVVAAAAESSLDPAGLWQAIATEPEVPQSGPLQSCHSCGLLAPLGVHKCRRCKGPLHRRKHEPLQRTWALLLTAVLLYVPANVLPVMRVTSIGHQSADTILEGVVYFVRSGSWPLALVIFTASVVVPLFKLGVLGLLLVSVQWRWRWRPQLRTRLYLLTELIGRWSMVDIFVVVLMVAMVEMGAIAQIEPEAGAMAFALVVTATMLASRSFDPRLIWDIAEPAHV